MQRFAKHKGRGVFYEKSRQNRAQTISGGDPAAMSGKNSPLSSEMMCFARKRAVNIEKRVVLLDLRRKTRHLTTKTIVFRVKIRKNEVFFSIFAETIDFAYIYIYNCMCELSFCDDYAHFLLNTEEKGMRIILDTDKKTITVPWNYQQKLEEYNKMVVEISGSEDKCKTFTGFIDDIWRECIDKSDKCVKTGKQPVKKEKDKEKKPKYAGLDAE